MSVGRELVVVGRARGWASEEVTATALSGGVRSGSAVGMTRVVI